MAPNPSIASRERAGRRLREQSGQGIWTNAAVAITSSLLALLLTTNLPWAQRWVYSGCFFESLLLVYGSTSDNRFFEHIPLWNSLTTLNLAYAVAATSRPAYFAFAVLCYTVLLSTCFLVFPTAASGLRKSATACLRLFGLGDRTAFFNLPALVFDASTKGTFVVQGLTVSLFSLTIEAHGVELGEYVGCVTLSYR